MKKLVVMFVAILFAYNAMASGIEIVDLGNGKYDIFDVLDDGSREAKGLSMSRSAAEKVASKYKKGGIEATWTKASSNLPVKPTTGTTDVVKWTGTQEMTPSVTPQKALPAPTSGGGGGGQPPKQITGPVAEGSTGGAKAAMTAGRVVGGVLGAVAVAAGTIDMVDNVKAKEEKATWADVGRGAMDGAAIGGGTVGVVGAFVPGVGTLVTLGATAVGAAGGAAVMGAHMFAETDCNEDPVLGGYACCNISKLSNIIARRVDIGGTMFSDEFPYVHKCVQGKKENNTEAGWLKARFLDDHWSQEKNVGLCSGYQKPNPGVNITPKGYYSSQNSVCWQWDCADPGMVRQGANCVVANPVTHPAQNVISDCDSDNLPRRCNVANADTALQYCRDGKWSGCEVQKCQVGYDLIKNACVKQSKPDPQPDANDSQSECKNSNDCLGKNGISQARCDSGRCVALACDNNSYLVYRDDVSMGWCRSKTGCPKGTHYDVRSDGKSVNQIGNAVCFKDDSLEPVIAPTEPEVTPEIVPQIIPDVVPEIPPVIAPVYNPDDALRARIEELTAKIDDKITTLDGSLKKWRNTDGSFNTARLASDSIAGVVLGTVGGVITSTIIKKHQVEDGFEDLKCTINGQSVAAYGDEFVVGIQ
ncbi:MAG: hypothetical protein ACLRFJ_00455 [Alphaproteobacteria bacterium]